MSANTHQLDATSFDLAIERADGPVLVDFWAEWCGPCRALGPTIDKIADRFGDTATIAKVDVDAHPDLAARYNVQSIPTVLIFNKGQVAQRFVGVQQEQTLADALDEVKSTLVS